MIVLLANETDCDPSLAAALERAGVAFRFAETEEALLDCLDGPDGPAVEAIAFDLGDPPEAGVERLTAFTANRPGPRIIAYSNRASLSVGVAAMKAGAHDFLPAPMAPARLLNALASLPRRDPMEGGSDPSSEAQPKKRRSPDRAPKTEARMFDRLIIESGAMRDVVREVKRGAPSMIPILLTGESGVGKEVFARAIHDFSDRRDEPFVAVNCGAIPEQLVESILFGHEKGAFTGAVERRLGKFVEADRGVLFLDEIGELPLDAQVKLLRALQEGEVDPVGGSRPVKTDIRVIAATNRDLASEIAADRFRRDLFYRVSVFPIRLPSLRERREDIVPLAELLARKWAGIEARAFVGFSEAAKRALREAPWPGNVRQLENAVYRALLLASGEVIDAEALVNLNDGLAPIAPMAAANSVDPFFDEEGEIRPLAEIEAAAMTAALERYDGSMSEASRRLGVGRSTLYRRLKGEAA
ncbi:MAG: sigma-54 dependent transcriptional regulator [Pseudomonadota bacterium]